MANNILRRPSEVIAEQLSDARVLLTGLGEKPDASDFAALLQWRSFSSHVAELEDELAQALGLDEAISLFCRKWNFEVRTDDRTSAEVVVCKHDHEKGQPCQYELMPAKELVETIEKLRSIILKRLAL